MATYEKIDDDTVETTIKSTATKEQLEQEQARLNKDIVHLNQNIVYKEALRDSMQSQLGEVIKQLALLT